MKAETKEMIDSMINTLTVTILIGLRSKDFIIDQLNQENGGIYGDEIAVIADVQAGTYNNKEYTEDFGKAFLFVKNRVKWAINKI